RWSRRLLAVEQRHDRCSPLRSLSGVAFLALARCGGEVELPNEPPNGVAKRRRADRTRVTLARPNLKQRLGGARRFLSCVGRDAMFTTTGLSLDFPLESYE